MVQRSLLLFVMAKIKDCDNFSSCLEDWRLDQSFYILINTLTTFARILKYLKDNLCVHSAILPLHLHAPESNGELLWSLWDTEARRHSCARCILFFQLLFNFVKSIIFDKELHRLLLTVLPYNNSNISHCPYTVTPCR